MTQNPSLNVLSSAALKDSLRGKDSLAAVVAALPRELRGHYTLVRQSRSFDLNGPPASAQFPRVILGNANASLLAAVSTHAGQTEGALEFLQFDAATNRYFPFVVEVTGGQVRFVDDPVAHYRQTAPERVCTRCHGENLRPIWDTYPEWPGLVGVRHRSGLAAEDYAIVNHVSELRQAGHAVFAGLEERPARALAEFNLQIENAMQKLNGRRVFQILKEHPRYEEFAWPLFLAIASPEGFAKWAPDSGADVELVWREVDVRRQIQADLKTSRRDGTPYVRRAYVPGADIHVLHDSAVNSKMVARMEFVFRRFGFSTREWSLALEKNAITWRSGAVNLEGVLLQSLAQDLLPKHPAIQFGLREISESYILNGTYFSSETFVNGVERGI